MELTSTKLEGDRLRAGLVVLLRWGGRARLQEMPKAPPKPTKTKRQPAIRSPADSAAGRTNVLLEEIQQQQRVVIDAVLDLDRKVDRVAQEIRQELSSQIDPLRIAVRQNSADIRTVLADTRGISEKLDVKADDGRVSSLEGRVQLLEGHVVA